MEYAVVCKLNEDRNIFNIVHIDLANVGASFLPMVVPLICKYCLLSDTKRLCFNMKSTNVGMSLINVWSVAPIVRNEWHASTPSVCGMLIYRTHIFGGQQTMRCH